MRTDGATSKECKSISTASSVTINRDISRTKYLIVGTGKRYFPGDPNAFCTLDIKSHPQPDICSDINNVQLPTRLKNKKFEFIFFEAFPSTQLSKQTINNLTKMITNDGVFLYIGGPPTFEFLEELKSSNFKSIYTSKENSTPILVSKASDISLSLEKLMSNKIIKSIIQSYCKIKKNHIQKSLKIKFSLFSENQLNTKDVRGEVSSLSWWAPIIEEYTGRSESGEASTLPPLILTRENDTGRLESTASNTDLCFDKFLDKTLLKIKKNRLRESLKTKSSLFSENQFNAESAWVAVWSPALLESLLQNNNFKTNLYEHLKIHNIPPSFRKWDDDTYYTIGKENADKGKSRVNIAISNSQAYISVKGSYSIYLDYGFSPDVIFGYLKKCIPDFFIADDDLDSMPVVAEIDTLKTFHF